MSYRILISTSPLLKTTDHDNIILEETAGWLPFCTTLHKWLRGKECFYGSTWKNLQKTSIEVLSYNAIA